MNKPKLQWVTQEHNLVANALGYNTHNKFMRKYCQELIDFDDNADMALHIVPADQFKPIPGKFNILFTMWEFLDIPESYKEGLSSADMVIVPCSFCKEIFQPYVKSRINVCWEGIEAEKYLYHERNYNSGKFRVLWVGAPNPRKGYQIVLELIKAIGSMPNIELYIKTTIPKEMERKDVISKIWANRKKIREGEDGHKFIKEHLKTYKKDIKRLEFEKLGPHANIIFDSRLLPLDELANLYKSAHTFILPTYGEGWGLTLCEAMATGAPCIATEVTGCKDYFNDSVGYPIKYEIKETELKNYDLTARGYVPDTLDVLKNILYVARNYGEAKKKGRKASERIHSKFTWKQSAERLYNILNAIKSEVKAA